jgi:hypothetical protein
MTIRPTSITVIGWILVVSGVMSLPGTFRTPRTPRAQEVAAKNPVPIPIQRAMSVAGTAVHVVCGYFLLQGKNWSRYLIVAWDVIQLSYGFIASPFKLVMILGACFLLLETYFLFRPRAQEFFAAVGANAEISNRMSWRQIASICCYIAAGSWLAVSCLLAFMTSPAFESKGFDFFDVSWKCWLLGITSVFPLIFLLIGQSLSPVRPRKREIGIVFLASASGGLLILLMMTLASLDPDWQTSLPPEKHWGLHDYSTGILWLGLLSALGGLALYSGREKVRTQKHQ